jgi:two-component system, NarL family, response regulator DevR
MPEKKVFYCFACSLSPAAESPPRTLHSAAANAVWELLKSEFRNEAAEAKMALALQVLSSHLLGAHDIEQALSVHAVLVKLLLPHAASEAETLKRPNCPRLFLLDGCSLKLPLGPLSGRLRTHSPGSKFLVLLPPERSGESEMMLLFHWGIDGFLTLHKKWKTELPKAALAVLQGGLWVPSGVLLAFVKQMKTMLDRQLLAGQSLTAREGQVLQLLFRHLTNKEIAHQLNIRERTAKFHVCNVLRKLGIENRRNLLATSLVN